MTILRGMDALKRLELSENARWFVAGLLAMALVWLQLGARPGVAADPEGVITAQSFRLVDDNGVVRGALGFSQEEYPMLVLCDAQGGKQIALVAGGVGPTLYMYDKTTKPVVVLNADPNDGQIFYMLGRNPESVVGMANTEMPMVAVMNGKGSPRAALAASQAQAALSLDGGPGKGEIGLAVKHDFGSLMFMNNGRDNGQLALGVTPRWTSVMAKDGDDSGLTLAVRKNRAPAMEMTENGRAVWSALGGGSVDDAELRGLFGGAGSGLNFDKLFK